MVRNESEWNDFKNRLEMLIMTSEEIANVSEDQKHMAIKKYFGFDDNTIKYFTFYRYNQALIDKLYLKAKPFVQE